jgi:hypothetical protein
VPITIFGIGCDDIQPFIMASAGFAKRFDLLDANFPGRLCAGNALQVDGQRPTAT